MVISRRSLIKGATALAAYSALPKQAEAASGVIAGAIRWDPWYSTSSSYSDGSQNVQFQNMLAPQTYQYRAPWFCSAPNNFQISCNAVQANIDTELQCAANAGIKFWAYDEPSAGTAHQIPWNFHQASAYKNLVNWCWISELGQLGLTGNYSTQVSGYVANYQSANYQTVLGGRPLHIVLWNPQNFNGHWANSYANVAAMITALRAACSSAGVGNPYIVVMDSAFTNAPSLDAVGIGADATSFYNDSNYGTYAALVSRCEGHWSTQAGFASGSSLGYIPTAVTGWDVSDDTVQPWSGGNSWAYGSAPTPYVGILNTAAPGTITQRASHIQDCVNFAKTNAAVCPSTVVLICAWSECAEEGGVLMPTIGDPPQAGNTTNFLSALSSILP